MRLLSTASAIALAAALAGAPALAAPPAGSTDTGSTSAATTPGSGNPTHAPVNNAPTNNAPNKAAGAAGTGATTNPGALGTAPNPGAGTAPAGTAANAPAANAPAGGGTAPAATSNANNNTPSSRNPVLTDNGEIRASKAIGSAVYDSHDKQIGSIDDILLDPKTHQAATAVISVGGFLGMGAKLVTVPYDKLQFGNANKNGDNKVVMPDATKDALNKMPSYHYTAANSKS